jgi:acetolactate synthase I/II/III large subunit
MDPAITLFEWPEIARLGDALGADSIIIRNLDSDMGRLAKLIAERSGPVLIDARFDPALAMR